MQTFNRWGSALMARGFAAVAAASMATLAAMALGAMGLSGDALAWTGQPLAYVATFDDNGNSLVEVIDTGSNTLMATVPIAHEVYARGAAVTPDGKRVYVVNGGDFPNFDGSVSVIDTASLTVSTSIPGFRDLSAVAVAPDGKHVYVTTSGGPGSPYQAEVSVIDTASNEVVARIPFPEGGALKGIAASPDGKHIYVTNQSLFSLSVIDTQTNATVATIQFGYGREANNVAISPDGKYAYVTIQDFDTGSTYGEPGSVAVIDIKSNTVLTRIPTGFYSFGIAVTPDGKRAYVANSLPDTISAIDSASNMVLGSPIPASGSLAATPDGTRIYVGSHPVSVIDTSRNTLVATVPAVSYGSIAIIPPPQGVQFLSFNAKLEINLDRKPSQDAFDLRSELTLSLKNSNGIHPDIEPVKLQVGPYIDTIPAGSFKQRKDGSYRFEGVIDGVRLEAEIEPTGTLRYAFNAKARGMNLNGTTNPVQVSLGVGNDAGLTKVKADIDKAAQAAAN